MRLKLFFVVLASIVLCGCPVEENLSSCRRVMVCEQEKEMYCDKALNGCGEDCHYYVMESCWEKCDEGGRLGEVGAIVH